jgi:UTP--glucose-1-phosphate uridylyltransferase
MIKKIVIPAAGLGTRLLPITKEIPKEMMPLFFKNKNGEVIVKPLIQTIYEKFFNFGLREYCIIVGRQKRTIEDHFTSNEDILKNLKKGVKYRKDLEEFYTKLNKSKIFWINQLSAKGFGDAVKYAESFVGNDDFLVTAGDTLLPTGDKIIKKLLNSKLKGKNDAILLLKKVSDPRRFGVAVVKKHKNSFQVINVEEKPKKPKSNLSIVAVYRFKPSIFKALDAVKNDKKELQLTSGIQKLIDWGGNVSAIILDEKDQVIDIGTTESYIETIIRYSTIGINHQ